MPRLRNTRTGSVVNVSDATAARLGADYEPVDASEAEAEKKPQRRARKAAKKSTDDE